MSQREIARDSSRSTPMQDRSHPVHLLTGYDKVLNLNQTACNEMFPPKGRPWLAHTTETERVTCRSCRVWLTKMQEEMDELTGSG